MSISVVVPIHNEVENLELLYARVTESLAGLNRP